MEPRLVGAARFDNYSVICEPKIDNRNIYLFYVTVTLLAEFNQLHASREAFHTLHLLMLDILQQAGTAVCWVRGNCGNCMLGSNM
jgi:hypothetical protein